MSQYYSQEANGCCPLTFKSPFLKNGAKGQHHRAFETKYISPKKKNQKRSLKKHLSQRFQQFGRNDVLQIFKNQNKDKTSINRNLSLKNTNLKKNKFNTPGVNKSGFSNCCHQNTQSPQQIRDKNVELGYNSPQRLRQYGSQKPQNKHISMIQGLQFNKQQKLFKPKAVQLKLHKVNSHYLSTPNVQRQNRSLSSMGRGSHNPPLSHAKFTPMTPLTGFQQKSYDWDNAQRFFINPGPQEQTRDFYDDYDIQEDIKRDLIQSLKYEPSIYFSSGYGKKQNMSSMGSTMIPSNSKLDKIANGIHLSTLNFQNRRAGYNQFSNTLSQAGQYGRDSFHQRGKFKSIVSVNSQHSSSQSVDSIILDKQPIDLVSSNPIKKLV